MVKTTLTARVVLSDNAVLWQRGTFPSPGRELLITIPGTKLTTDIFRYYLKDHYTTVGVYDQHH
jgi:hypothetical protein